MFRQQLRAILRAAAHGQVRILIPMVAHLSEIQPDRRGACARAPAARRRRPRRTADVELGAMIEVPAAALIAAGVPAALRLRLDRHQRPDPVHAGDRPRRRSGRASLRPLASGGAAAGRADDRSGAQRPARTSASAARWRAIPRSRELLLGDGPAQLLDASVADPDDQAAHPRAPTRARLGARSSDARSLAQRRSASATCCACLAHRQIRPRDQAERPPVCAGGCD